MREMMTTSYQQLSRYDDGVYEVDFKVGNTEYDYEIGATDGSIRKANVEQDD